MKFCLVGSLVPIEVFDEIVRNSKVKPSNAPENFQMMFAKGMGANGQELDVISFPNIATYPHGYKLFLKKKKYQLDFGTKIVCPTVLNLTFIKQFMIFVQTYIYVKKWIKNNKDVDKRIILYSDYPPQSIACRWACKTSNNTKNVLYMTDLPTFESTNHKRGLKTLLGYTFDYIRKKNYSKFDEYILITKHMAKKMGIEDKPYIVVEGFSDPEQYSFEQEKSENKTLMYCGAISNIHNTDSMIDAFLMTDIDAEFWIFGAGDAEIKVKNAEKIDSRVKYFGKVSRQELLKRQKMSSLLISAKASNDEHTNYAFPSKILEYMTSGTPVLSTKVGGIPEEYFDYIYTINDESVNGISDAIKKYLNLTEEVLKEKGNKSKEFVVREKNCTIQTKKIIDFLCRE